MKLTVKQKKAIAFLTAREVVEKPKRSKVPDHGTMKLCTVEAIKEES